MEPDTTDEQNDVFDTAESKPKNSLLYIVFKLFAGGIFLLLLAGSFGVWYANTQDQPPENFPVNQSITIEPGTNVKDITEQLQAENVVKSAQLLYYILAFAYEPSNIKASTYIFEEPLKAHEVAQRLTEGDFDNDLVRFTHFEGERVSVISARAGEIFPEFNQTRFLENTTDLEGRLFPETYFVPNTFTDEELLRLMLNTYEERVSSLRESIARSPLSESEVIVLASIIEREANTPESMKVVAGILLNRLEIGMALQADASIEYVIETPLGQLPEGQLASELRELDSPYNTYLYTGLPPTPIGNPGLDAITAVLTPTESEYFYYITDENGDFYYSETYNEHLQNIAQYLR